MQQLATHHHRRGPHALACGSGSGRGAAAAVVVALPSQLPLLLRRPRVHHQQRRLLPRSVGGVSGEDGGARPLLHAVAAPADAPPPSSSSSSSAPAAELPGEQSDDADAAPPAQRFNWHKQWYPVAVVDDLDKEAPCSRRVLDTPLAIWWEAKADGGAGAWRAYLDRCPHRLAPLSEGRIDELSGCLQCTYHGWVFEGERGNVARVPQLPPEQARRLPARRASAASYPTRVAEGLLWVWMESTASSPSAWADSAAPGAWRGLAPEIDAAAAAGGQAWQSRFASHGWYMREMPLGWLAAKENAYNDPSHDRVLHHGVSPAMDRKLAAPREVALLSFGEGGYVNREAEGLWSDTASFPCGSRRDYPYAAGVAYVVPSRPGAVIQFHAFLSRPDKALPCDLAAAKQAAATAAAPEAGAAGDGGGAGAGAAASPPPPQQQQQPQQQGPLAALRAAADAALWPAWRWHVFSSLLLDADLVMQAGVDANRARDARVFMPSSMDCGPSAFMRWVKSYGNGGPPGVASFAQPFGAAAAAAAGSGGSPVALSDRRRLLDRFEQHTKTCTACRTAHARFAALQRAAGVAAVVAAAAAVATGGLLLALGGVGGGQQLLPAAAATRGWAVAGALAALAALAAYASSRLARLVQAFVFVDYDKHHVSKQP